MFTLNGVQRVFGDVFRIPNTSSDYCYLALSSTEPTKSGENVTEPEENGYERVAISRFVSSVALNSDGSTFEITNNKEIHFTEATGDWGVITHFAIYSNKTGGTPLYVGALTEAIHPTANTVALIKVGQLKITLI